MTKAQEQIYNRYLASTTTRLCECYSNWSIAKENAMDYCLNLMREYGGYGLKIIGFNSMTFSVGFEFVDCETGQIMFAYITRDHDRTWGLEWKNR